MVGTVRFEARIRKLVENLPDLAALVEPLLVVRRTLREQFCILHRRLLAIVRDDEVCRRMMTTPGVGPVVSLTYRATVDVPARFRKSKSVGAVFWTDVRQVSIGRGRLGRQNIALWRRDDAGHALRSSSGHDAFQEMVLAESLGDADRQAPRDEKGDRGAGTSAGRDHAPHVGGRYRVPLEPRTSLRSSMKSAQDQIQ